MGTVHVILHHTYREKECGGAFQRIHLCLATAPGTAAMCRHINASTIEAPTREVRDREPDDKGGRLHWREEVWKLGAGAKT